MISRRLAAAFVAFMLTGCGGITDPPAGDTPFVYLLLSPTPVSNVSSVADSTPWALVATLQTPVVAHYREVASFRLERVRDGADFVWLSRTMPGTFPGGFDGVLIAGGANANVTLSVGGDSGGLGWRGLTGGDDYNIHVAAGGARPITGRATIPEQPILQLTESGSAHIVRWQRARGAAGYYVAPSDAAFGRFSTDTAFAWCESPYGPPDAPRYLRVVALDSNAFRYLGDTTTARAGLDGALGLFGGANEARIAPTTPRPTGYDTSCSPAVPAPSGDAVGTGAP